MDLGACCTHSVVLQPPDAVVGQQSSRALECSQRCVRFVDCLPISPPPIADGILGAGDSPDRGTELEHHQSTSEKGTPKGNTTNPLLKRDRSSVKLVMR